MNIRYPIYEGVYRILTFKLYLLKEFQRLKEEEQAQLGWSAKRELSKINYRIHTDAIRQNPAAFSRRVHFYIPTF